MSAINQVKPSRGEAYRLLGRHSNSPMPGCANSSKSSGNREASEEPFCQSTAPFMKGATLGQLVEEGVLSVYSQVPQRG